MKFQRNIKTGLTERFIYLAFAILLSIPVGGYFYGFHGLPVSYRTELLYSPSSIFRKSCYQHAFTKAFHNKIVSKNKIIFKTALFYFAEKVKNQLFTQKAECFLIPEIKLIPLLVYCNDNEDDVRNS